MLASNFSRKYVEGVSATPIQTTREDSLVGDTRNKIQVWVEKQWASSPAASYGLSCDCLDAILLQIGNAQNWGAAQGTVPDETMQLRFLGGLRIEELVLARACAAGDEKAWEVFIMR